MPDATLIQIIIQGGAVGLMAALFFFLYKFSIKALALVENVLTNHLEHLTESADGLNRSVERMMDRMDYWLFKIPPGPSSDEPSSSEPASDSDEAPPA
ncbi:hypothetical protein LCGC14_0860410 [marine sediment metagenome]|uniref:Uncharacterized protein n=1 Tax=marine sediment metagenome TaxID=412755 RepID=A0A0F9SEN8_9ZZZZ